jgi:hypothetical protein
MLLLQLELCAGALLLLQMSLWFWKRFSCSKLGPFKAAVAESSTGPTPDPPQPYPIAASASTGPAVPLLVMLLLLLLVLCAQPTHPMAHPRTDPQPTPLLLVPHLHVMQTPS